MRMWKAYLLVFDDVHIRDNAAHDLLVCEHLHQFLQFEVKHLRDDVWPVCGCLSVSERAADFRPIWVACQCNEQVRFPVFSHDGHCILVILMHRARTSGE